MNAADIISVVIVTYRREHAVVRLLEALCHQTDRNFSVVIVEQGTSHERMFRSKASALGLGLTYRFISIPNTPNARNEGLRMADGDIVLYLDDDSLPDAEWVSSMRTVFGDDPGITGVVGRVKTPGQPQETGRRDTGRVRGDGSVSDGFSSIVYQEGISAAIGCNMGWRTSVLKRIGGFDHRYTGNAMREETDVSFRLIGEGYRVVFEPSALVTHLREPSGGARKADDRISWYFHYLSNETYFFLRHVRRTALLPFAMRMTGPVLRCMFGFGREVSTRSVTVPVRAIADGIGKYYDYKTHGRR